MKFCQKCGGQIPEGTNECPICGLVVNATPTPQPTPVENVPIEPVVEVAPQPVVPAPVTEVPVAEPVQSVPVTPVQTVATPPVAPTPMQPMSAPTPMYTPPVQAAVPNPTTKSNGVPIILVIILLVVVAAAGMVLGKVLFGGPKAEKKENTNTQEVSNGKDEEKEDEDEEDYIASSSQTVTIERHKLTIPNEYQYEMDEGLLYVADDTGEWVIQLGINMGDYDMTVEKFPDMIAMMEQAGAIIGSVIDQTIEGKVLKTFEMTIGEEKAVFGLTKISDKYYATVLAAVKGTADLSEVLKNSVSILNTAEEQTSRSMESSISISDIFSNVSE